MSNSITDQEFSYPDGSRTVPVRCYEPTGEPRGWILFSVGYGGNRDGYAFLARAWTELGLAVVVTEHVGSNLEVLKSFSQLRRAERNAEVVRRVHDPDELRARVHDIHLVYGELSAFYFGLPFGLAGHSYGSYSALAGCGMESNLAPHSLGALPVDSLLVVSPQPPDTLFSSQEYTKVHCPCLVLTGSEDHLLDGSSTFRERMKVFESLTESERHLLVLKGVEHMTFAGIGLKVEAQLAAISSATSVWWEDSLLESGHSRAWPERLGEKLDSDWILECR
ncbi:MAG TPA: hypothetical protein EYO33_00615 [Phycisphaerales bacterium]|nr:hypothetical protein [Phycisphaerales bacterium]